MLCRCAAALAAQFKFKFSGRERGERGGRGEERERREAQRVENVDTGVLVSSATEKQLKDKSASVNLPVSRAYSTVVQVQVQVQTLSKCKFKFN